MDQSSSAVSVSSSLPNGDPILSYCPDQTGGVQSFPVKKTYTDEDGDSADEVFVFPHHVLLVIVFLRSF